MTNIAGSVVLGLIGPAIHRVVDHVEVLHE